MLSPGSSSSVRVCALIATPEVGNTPLVTVVSASLELVWATPFTRTATVPAVLISPVKASVSVASVPPAVAPDTLKIDRLGIAVTNSKLDAFTPLAKVVPIKCTAILALFRSASVKDDGVVDLTRTSSTLIVKVCLA